VTKKSVLNKSVLGSVIIGILAFILQQEWITSDQFLTYGGYVAGFTGIALRFAISKNGRGR